MEFEDNIKVLEQPKQLIDEELDKNQKIFQSNELGFLDNMGQTQETRIQVHSPVVEALSDFNVDEKSFDRSRILAGSAN